MKAPTDDEPWSAYTQSVCLNQPSSRRASLRGMRVHNVSTGTTGTYLFWVVLVTHVYQRRRIVALDYTKLWATLRIMAEGPVHEEASMSLAVASPWDDGYHPRRHRSLMVHVTCCSPNAPNPYLPCANRRSLPDVLGGRTPYYGGSST